MKEILVIDLEATCWEGEPPQGQESEIIEIGMAVVKYNLSQGYFYFGSMEPSSLIIKPQVSEVSPFCTTLTGITPEIVSGGMSFSEALENLKEHKDKPWASWGEYDKRMLTNQSIWFGEKMPLSYRHINMKSVWMLLTGKWEGLKTAVESTGSRFMGKNHRAGDDALNVAYLLQVVLERYHRRREE